MFSYSPPKDKTGWSITVLADTPGSWIEPWSVELVECLAPYHDVRLCRDHEGVKEGDFCFILGCLKLLAPETLQKNKHNLVVHESDLPKGRGWSPVAWQVLGGADEIPVCLFEAVEEADAGPVYLRDSIKLDGTELLPEIRRRQGMKTVQICLDFLLKWPDLTPAPQSGEATFFPRRTMGDDRLDPDKSLAGNFNHLRIVDNENYPAWFEHKGRRFTLKIFPLDRESGPGDDQ
ncbi:MAG: formyltransferase family protein [Thermodesulfobacteriota bacterium]|nr:formyltransferase family protein [Thermodesulfobacteriota bacterium]